MNKSRPQKPTKLVSIAHPDRDIVIQSPISSLPNINYIPLECMFLNA